MLARHRFFFERSFSLSLSLYHSYTRVFSKKISRGKLLHACNINSPYVRIKFCFTYNPCCSFSFSTSLLLSSAPLIFLDDQRKTRKKIKKGQKKRFCFGWLCGCWCSAPSSCSSLAAQNTVSKDGDAGSAAITPQHFSQKKHHTAQFPRWTRNLLDLMSIVQQRCEGGEIIVGLYTRVILKISIFI